MRFPSFHRFNASIVVLAVTVILLSLFDTTRGEVLNNKELEFTGTVASVAANGNGVGTLFVQFDDLRLRVIVNASTTVQDQAGADIGMSDLAVGDALKVQGKFSSDGILASQIQVSTKASNDFQVRGHITAVQRTGADTLISLLGLTVVVNADTSITSDGATMPALELRSGLLVQAEGTIAGSIWKATAIRVLSGDKQRSVLTFQGTVSAITGGVLQVQVEGVAGGVTIVRLGSNTDVSGELVVGSFVEVRGTLDADFSVAATRIRVLLALEIKPEERKLKVGEAASFTVKLRETAASDVQVSLSSSDTSVATLSTGNVTIGKGAKTAVFNVNGIKTGSAVISAQALGQKATALVTVGEMSEEESERPAVRIAFAPDHLKMGLNESRDVVLLIQPPPQSAVSVQFTVRNNLVTIGGTRGFSNGAAALKVTVQSGAREGADSVIATLPAELGGGKAELIVQVSGQAVETGRKAVIAFRPDSVKLAVGETRGVTLQSSQPLDKDVTLSLTSGGNVVQAPASVTLSAGSRSVTVSVTGKAAGKVNLTATLPATIGGGTASLDVEVRNRP
jgi:hypothetical protein